MKELEASRANTAKRLKGNERFLFDEKELPLLEDSVKDFWSWANSDLLNNTTRGVLAEFLVAQALRLDISNGIRKEWEPYDFLDLDGETKIEVKCAAYVQTWHQDCCPKSPIKFEVKPKKVEEEKHFKDERRCKRPWSKERKRRCHVYVFCLHKEEEISKISPLDISQWEFYAVRTQKLDELDKNEIYLSDLEEMAEPVPFAKLRYAVDQLRDQGTVR